MENSKKTNEAMPQKPNMAKSLMTKFNVKEIYENSRGEFFLELSLAVASENGDEKNVKTHKQ